MAPSLREHHIVRRMDDGTAIIRTELPHRRVRLERREISTGRLLRAFPDEARVYSSMAENHVARRLCQVLDDAIQMHGSLGYSEDMPFSMWYRFARSARSADGPMRSTTLSSHASF